VAAASADARTRVLMVEFISLVGAEG